MQWGESMGGNYGTRLDKNEQSTFMGQHDLCIIVIIK